MTLNNDWPRSWLKKGTIEVLEASTWGPMPVARHLFEQLGLWQILDAGRRWKRLLSEEDPNDDWPSRVLALLANRLVCPGSEHALAGDRLRVRPSWPALRTVLETAGTCASRLGAVAALVPHA